MKRPRAAPARTTNLNHSRSNKTHGTNKPPPAHTTTLTRPPSALTPRQPRHELPTTAHPPSTKPISKQPSHSRNKSRPPGQEHLVKVRARHPSGRQRLVPQSHPAASRSSAIQPSNSARPIHRSTRKSRWPNRSTVLSAGSTMPPWRSRPPDTAHTPTRPRSARPDDAAAPDGPRCAPPPRSSAACAASAYSDSRCARRAKPANNIPAAPASACP